MKRALRFAFLAATFSAPAAAAAPASSWVDDPFAHVVLRADAPGPAREFMDVLAKAGGHVAVLYPSGTAVVQADAAVLESPGVAAWIERVDIGEIDVAWLKSADEAVARSARVWNLSLAMYAQAEVAAHAQGDPQELARSQFPDAGPLTVALPQMPAFKDAPTHIPYGAQYYDTSSFLAGSTAVGVWLLEAAGASYDWSQAEEDETLAGVQTALTDWVTRAGVLGFLSFVVEIHTDAPVSGVPIENSQASQGTWVGEALANAGWPGADAFQRCFAYNNSIRDLYQTNWCFSYFIVDSDPNVNLGLFAGGGYAWGYYGGPWVYMSRYSTWAYNWPNYFRAVPMHEMGHIFYATDEYDGQQQWSGYLLWQDTASTSVNCLMNQNVYGALCVPSRRQVGWLDVDGNGVTAPLDLAPTADLVPLLPDPTADFTPTWSGRAVVRTLDNQNPNDVRYSPPHDVTVAKIVAVECRVDGGDWSAATATDGAFDAYGEDFAWTSPPLANGVHIVQARAQTSVGIWTSAFDFDELTVTGSPVDAPVLSVADALRVTPNPSHGVAQLAWRVAAGPVAISIFNAAGRRVVAWSLADAEGGLTWNGRADSGAALSSGVYLIRLDSAHRSATRRFVLLQ